MEFETNYKGFEIQGTKHKQGFNQWTLTIAKYKYKGFKEECYFLDLIRTYGSSKTKALRIIKNHIDNLKIEYNSNGLMKADYLPSIYD